MVFEGRQCFLDLPLERDGNEDTHIAEQAVLIEHGGITANDAFLFQLADTAQRRREGKADPGRQIAPAHPPVIAEHMENLLVETVELNHGSFAL
ncbi:hypothetical protein D3C86_1983520 [compost metagenome]